VATDSESTLLIRDNHHKNLHPAHGFGPRNHQPSTLVVSNLTKTFGSKVAVEEVNLELKPGTFLVLLGPSGSGKSTLLRCIAGIESPSSGSIALEGALVDGPKVHVPPEKRNLAMVFQDYALWPHLTAEQNVSFALKRLGLSRQERTSRAISMLEQVGLAGLEHRFPGELSGGEQQRVALARALVARPKLLLFDEPLSNLDADRRERLRVDIGTMVRRQEATVVYITHDQSEAFALADQVGLLQGGRLVQLDTPEKIYEYPVDPFVARFTGLAGEVSGVLEDVQGGSGSEEMVLVKTAAGRIVGRPLRGLRKGLTAPRTGAPERGARVRVLVRPFSLSLARGEYPGSTLAGRVMEAAFRGWGYEHLIEIPGGHQLAGLRSERRLSVGAPVEVELRPKGCLVIAEEES
jgi:iron(III) transport system ATP-binding protein